MSILIIIPAYNEEEAIEQVIKDLDTHAAQYDRIVINDGSTDQTEEIARSLSVPVISLPFNTGIGCAVQTGYRYALYNDYDIAVQFDGDGQHRADQIKRLIEPILNNEADMVVGSRFLEDTGFEKGIAKAIGLGILSKSISLLVGKRLTDTTSGFRAVNKKVIEFFADYYPDDYPEPESIVLAHKKGFRIKEVSTPMRQRQGGRSSITPLRSIYYLVKVLLAVFIDIMKKI